MIPLLAANVQQAGTAFAFVEGVFASSPGLKGLVAGATSETPSLATRIDIQVRPASFRTIRGITAVAAICDEIAFWFAEGANPDEEILRALKPSLATTGGPLVCISSPRAKRGALHAAHKRHFGAGGHPLILVAQAASRVMNPSLPQSVVDRAFEEDAESAAAEFNAEFRSDLEQFVSREAIEACVAKGVTVRAPVAGVRYFGFCDPSGGSADSMTLAIAHADGKRVVVDCVVETRPPFSPDQTVAEFASVFRSYGVTTVVGDRYASSWPPERFFAHGIKYEASEMTHSELYLNFLPLVNSARVELLDNSRMVSQFASLERRVARSGQDSVDSPKNMHEDIANSVAGACVLAAARPREMDISDQFIDDLNALSAADRQAAWEYSRDWGTAGDFPRW